MTVSRRSVAVLAILLLPPAVSHAAALDQTLRGVRLEVAGPCAARVAIRGGGTGSIEVHATADHTEELGVLAIGTAGGTASVRRRTGDVCWRPDGAGDWTPTLALAITVPAGTPVSISDNGAADYRIQMVGGALALALAGATTVETDAATSLQASMSGTSKVRLQRANGPASLDLAGADTVDIDLLRSDRLRIDASGRSTVEISAGEIGSLAIDSVGASAVSVGATVSDATVATIGAATVRIARVTGRLEKRVLGTGSVTVRR